MIKEIGEILVLILVMAGIFALTWLTTRFLSRRLPGGGKTRHLQIIEKLPVGKSQQIALVRVGDEHFMVGISGQQISFSQGFRLPEPAAADTCSEVNHENQDA